MGLAIAKECSGVFAGSWTRPSFGFGTGASFIGVGAPLEVADGAERRRTDEARGWWNVVGPDAGDALETGRSGTSDIDSGRDGAVITAHAFLVRIERGSPCGLHGCLSVGSGELDLSFSLSGLCTGRDGGSGRVDAGRERAGWGGSTTLFVG